LFEDPKEKEVRLAGIKEKRMKKHIKPSPKRKELDNPNNQSMFNIGVSHLPFSSYTLKDVGVQTEGEVKIIIEEDKQDPIKQNFSKSKKVNYCV